MKIYFTCLKICVLCLFATIAVAQESTISVKILKDLRYASKPEGFDKDTSSDRTLDLYLPERVGNGKLPVFLFVHGGGFSGGDKNSIKAICEKVAASGYAVASINYRLHLRQNKIPGASATSNMGKGLPDNGQFNPGLQTAVRIASEDAQLALGWIVKQAKEYNFDTSKIAISGGSAGAMTALYTAYVSGQKVVPIRAVVDLWGGLENATVIKKGAAALLIFHGDKDPTINVAYAHALHQQMEKMGNTSVLNIMEGVGHAAYKLIASEKIPVIVAFLQRTMK